MLMLACTRAGLLWHQALRGAGWVVEQLQDQRRVDAAGRVRVVEFGRDRPGIQALVRTMPVRTRALARPHATFR